MRTAIVNGFILIALAVGLQAQTNHFCEPTLFSSDAAVVQTAALDRAIADLVNVGADVRVRAMPHVGASTLDEHERIVERGCASWQAPDGGRKNNLIVVMIAVADRKTGIYYGSQWSVLQSQWPHIQSAVMAPRFRDKDYSGGLAAGLEEIRTVLTTRQSASAVVVQQQASAPTDFSGLWTVMLWGVMLAAGGGLLWFGWAWVAARRAQREERLGAQQAALIAQQEASGLVADSAGWPENEHAKVIMDTAIQGYSQLGMGAVDPSREDLTAPQYHAIRQRYEAVSAEIKRAHRIAKGDKEPSPVIDNSAEFLGRKKRYSAPVRERVRERIVVHEHHDSVVPIYIPGGPNIVPVYIPEPVAYDPTPSRHYDPPAPATTPSYDGGGSSSWGSSSSSSDSGGSSSWGSSSSSSDSGGSSDFGSSDCGGGGSSDW